MHMTLKEPPPSPPPPVPPRSPGDDMSVAFSETSSSSNQNETRSWICKHCGFTNGDPTKEICAMCGIIEHDHVKRYRKIMIERRKLSSSREFFRGGSDYQWFSPSEHSNQDGKTDDDDLKIISDTDKELNIEASSIVAVGEFFDSPERKACSDGLRTPKGSTTAKPQRVPTPYVSTKWEKERKSKTFRSTDNIEVMVSNVSKIRPGLHEVKPDALPSKRPPRSPVSQVKRATTSHSPSSSSAQRPWVSFTQQDFVSSSDSGRRGRRVRQSSVTSSTAALKSGQHGYFFAPTSDAKSDPSTTTAPPTSSSSLSVGGDNSVSRLSYSSKSTVKASNMTASTTSKPNLKETFTIVEKTTPGRVQDDENVLSLVPPRRNQSTPSTMMNHFKKSASAESQGLRRYQSVRSTGTPVDVIHEDLEQSSTPEPPRIVSVVSTTLSKSKVIGSRFVPPTQLFHAMNGGESTVTEREFTLMSLERTERLPSVSSFASSTVSARMKSILCEIDDSQHSHTMGEEDCENQSVMEDDAVVDHNEKPRQSEKRHLSPLWLIIPVVAVVVVLLSVFLSTNSSSSKFQVMPTADLTSIVTSFPSLSPTLDSSFEESVGADAEEFNENLDSNDGSPIEEKPEQESSLFYVDRLLSERGSDVEGLGLSVAVGGDGLVAMLGNGFVRVVGRTTSFPGSLTWPVQPSELLDTGFGQSVVMGNDINFNAALPISDVVMSGDGKRLALTIDTGLVVWDYDVLDKEWKQAFADRVFANGLGHDDFNVLANAVSLSYDGRYVASAALISVDAETNLVVRFWGIESFSNGKILAQFVKKLDESSNDQVSVEMSLEGDVLAVCTAEQVFVTSINDIEDRDDDASLELESTSSMNFDLENATISSCGLSGDGRTIAISSHDSEETSVYSFHNSSWSLGSLIPFSGSSLSLDHEGKLIGIGANIEGVISLWSKDAEDRFQTVNVFREPVVGARPGTVALTKHSGMESSHYMTLGFPHDGGRVDLYKIQSI